MISIGRGCYNVDEMGIRERERGTGKRLTMLKKMAIFIRLCIPEVELDTYSSCLAAHNGVSVASSQTAANFIIP